MLDIDKMLKKRQPKRSRLLPFSVIFTAAFSYSAYGSDLLTAYNQALEYDSSIAASNSAYLAQREGENIARASLLPQLSFSASATHQDGSSDLSGDDSYVANTFGVSLTQPVFRATNWFSYQASKKNTEAAQTQFEIAQQQLLLDVAVAYFNVLKAQDGLATAEAAETAFKRQWEQAQERFDVGLIAITEVHEARATYDAGRTSRIQSEGNLDIAKESLSRLTGQQVDSINKLSKDFPISSPAPNTIEEWVNKAIEQNLSIKASQQGLAALDDSLSLSKAGHYPTLDLVASYDDTDLNGLNPADDNQNSASISLSLNMPLYQGGSTQASIRQARYQLEEARHNLNTLTRNVKLETTSLFRTINTDIQTVNSRKQLIISRESALEATRAGYSVGTRNIVEVLDAERNYYSALFDYADARYDYVIDTLKLKQATGTLSPQDIIDLNSRLEAIN